MTIRWDMVDVNGQQMRVYSCFPGRPGPTPGILVAMHGLGLDAPMLDVVHRLHRAGYAAAMPDLFHRQPTGIIDPLARLKLMRDDDIVIDMNAALGHLRCTGSVGPVAVIGFCMGGRIAYLMCCTRSDIKAGAIFYGGGISEAWGDGPSPLARTADLSAPIIGFFGDADHYVPVTEVRAVETELNRLAKWHEFHVYKDAGHGFLNFTSPDRYRRRAARAAWEELLAFLDERVTLA